MTFDHASTVPPRWAEWLLRLLVNQSDRDAISGDLLEEYREVLVRTHGRLRADLWYLREVTGVVWHAGGAAGLILAASFVGRDMVDWWLSPTDDFYARSVVSTWLAVATFTGVGVRAGWRSRSVCAATAAGLTAGGIAAVLIAIVSGVQLALRHDPHTMQMIAASGGLHEVFLLPLIAAVPGTLCATLGGVVARLAGVVRPPASNHTA